MIYQYTIPLAALIVSITTLIITGLSLRKKANQETTNEMQNTIKQLRDDTIRLDERLKECERIRIQLFGENVELLKKVINKHK